MSTLSGPLPPTGGVAPVSSSSSTAAGSSNFILSLKTSLTRQFQYYLDKSVPQITARWIALGLLVLIYCVRVYFLQGFYIVTYGLGIFLLNLFIGFLSPLEEDVDGPVFR